MMLEHLDQAEAGSHVQQAVASTLAAGEVRTRDLGGDNTTDEVGAAVEQAMRAGA
jgi:tartrate dehydrogenase/decarboxylase/D-malate dehydrogenase